MEKKAVKPLPPSRPTKAMEQEGRAYQPNGLDPRICAYCVNRGRERCVTSCVPEGKFRHLEPVALEFWEEPPRLPPYREMVDMSPFAVRALMWLSLYYLEATRERGS